jgi:hypothetical protein
LFGTFTDPVPADSIRYRLFADAQCRASVATDGIPVIALLCGSKEDAISAHGVLAELRASVVPDRIAIVTLFPYAEAIWLLPNTVPARRNRTCGAAHIIV